MAFGLWDEVSRDKHRPKSEEKMSDALAAFLKRDLPGRGVVVNREVVIRPGEKPGVEASGPTSWWTQSQNAMRPAAWM
jgi:hypothetical protein